MNFTYKELEEYVEKEWDDMSDDERYQRLKNCDPTYAHWVLSTIPNGSSVYINFETNEHEIIK